VLEANAERRPVSPLAGFLLGWAVLAAAFAVTSWLLNGMEVSGGVWGYIWVSAIFGLVNAIIGTFLRIVTLPFRLVTLGLISLLLNAVLLSITDALTDHLSIDEFWWTAIWAALLLAVVTVVLQVLVHFLLTKGAR
jgi:putative membrane protein